MFHNLKKENKSNTQDDPSATSHEKNGRIFRKVSRFSSICKLTIMPVSHEVPSYLKNVHHFLVNRSLSNSIHLLFTFHSGSLPQRHTPNYVLTTKLLLCLAMPLSFCNHLYKTPPHLVASHC